MQGRVAAVREDSTRAAQAVLEPEETSEAEDWAREVSVLVVSVREDWAPEETRELEEADPLLMDFTRWRISIAASSLSRFPRVCS